MQKGDSAGLGSTAGGVPVAVVVAADGTAVGDVVGLLVLAVPAKLSMG